MSDKADYMVIDFTADGGAEAMHRDGFDLGFLGKQKIERASDIRFDEDKQSWAIWLNTPNGYILPDNASGFATYETARKTEVCWLEYCRLSISGNDPTSPLANAALQTIRSMARV
jgi:hypothetical protein